MVSVQGAIVGRPGPRFTAVEMSRPAFEPKPAAPDFLPSPETAERSPVLPAGLIEIMLRGGVSLGVDAQVDGRALRCVLRALESR